MLASKINLTRNKYYREARKIMKRIESRMINRILGVLCLLLFSSTLYLFLRGGGIIIHS